MTTPATREEVVVEFRERAAIGTLLFVAVWFVTFVARRLNMPEDLIWYVRGGVNAGVVMWIFVSPYKKEPT